MSSVRHLAVPELNDQLTCMLCTGYLIDATTITECLHSFCRSCLVRYFDLNNTCPKCKVQVHKTRPLLNIRPDKTLQDLVYKLVPGVFKAEMKRRREFYADHPDSLPDPTCPNASELRGDIMEDRFEHVEDERISLVLQHYTSDPNEEDVLLLEQKYMQSKTADQRFLLCPGGLPIGHLKKFVRCKFNLDNHLKVEIFHSDETLSDSYTLSDVAELYSWRRVEPLKLYYLVHVRRSVTVLPAPRPKLLPLPQPHPDRPKKKVTKKLKRLAAPKTGVTKKNLVNGLRHALQNSSKDNTTVTTSLPVRLTSASSVEECREGTDASSVGNISVDTICDNAVMSSDGALSSPDQGQVTGVKARTVSPTNNNESAVHSPCKNCPPSGCAHSKKVKLRMSVVAKDLTSSLAEGESSSSAGSSDSEGGNTSGSEVTDGGDSPVVITEADAGKLGFRIRKVTCPNFSGVLKIPIVPRKIMSPSAIGGVVRSLAPDIRPGSSPPSPPAAASPSPPPVTRVTEAPASSQNSAPEARQVTTKSDKDTPANMNGSHGNAGITKCDGADSEGGEKSSEIQKDTISEVPGTKDVRSPSNDGTTLVKETSAVNGTTTTSIPAVVDNTDDSRVKDTTAAEKFGNKLDNNETGIKQKSPPPLVPAVKKANRESDKQSTNGSTPSPVVKATQPSPVVMTTQLPVVKAGSKKVSALLKKQPAGRKKSVGAHGGTPTRTPGTRTPGTPPKSPSRSPKPILPKGPCGPMAHGCLPAKRPSPPGPGGRKAPSPPKRLRLNVCHGVQNIQSSVSLTTSPMMSLTPNIAHSGHPVFMTSVPHVMSPVRHVMPPSMTYGRHLHPAFYLHPAVTPPVANGYDAPLELTTKRRDS